MWPIDWTKNDVSCFVRISIESISMSFFEILKSFSSLMSIDSWIKIQTLPPARPFCRCKLTISQLLRMKLAACLGSWNHVLDKLITLQVKCRCERKLWIFKCKIEKSLLLVIWKLSGKVLHYAFFIFIQRQFENYGTKFVFVMVSVSSRYSVDSFDF